MYLCNTDYSGTQSSSSSSARVQPLSFSLFRYEAFLRIMSPSISLEVISVLQNPHVVEAEFYSGVLPLRRVAQRD
jgi:hypothetical protein